MKIKEYSFEHKTVLPSEDLTFIYRPYNNDLEGRFYLIGKSISGEFTLEMLKWLKRTIEEIEGLLPTERKGE